MSAISVQPYARQKDRIATAADKARINTGGRANNRQWLAMQLQGQGASLMLENLEKPPAGQSVKAIVDSNRWVVHCPDCSGAEVVDPADPVFFCLSCLNMLSKPEGRFRRVIFPENRREIEKSLVRRPPINRNWTDEPIEILEIENAVHGIGGEKDGLVNT